MTTPDNDFRQQNYARIVAKAWHDPEFKKRLKADPNAVLAEEKHPGVAGKKVTVVEEDPSTKYFILPKKPDGSSFEDLHAAAKAHVDLGICCCI